MLRTRAAPPARVAGGCAIVRGWAAAAGYQRNRVVARHRERHKPGAHGPASRSTSYAKSVADPPRGIVLSERLPSHYTKSVADPRLGIVLSERLPRSYAKSVADPPLESSSSTHGIQVIEPESRSRAESTHRVRIRSRSPGRNAGEARRAARLAPGRDIAQGRDKRRGGTADREPGRA